MMMNTCFNSSDPAAPNATLLYDFNNDDDNLWVRSSQDVHLPPCPSSAQPPDSGCLVCLKQIVYAVCRNLADGVEMMMQAGGLDIKVAKSECPKPPSDDVPQFPAAATILIPILLILILILILIGVVFFIYWKCFRGQENPDTQGSRRMEWNYHQPSPRQT